MQPGFPGRPQSREEIERALLEQGADSAQIAEWRPVVERLADWPAREPTLQDARRLLNALAPLLPSPSPARIALRARSATQRRRVEWLFDLLATARTQVSVLRPPFWLVSSAIAILGIYIELSQLAGDSTFILQVLGPLLVYISMSTVFRGAGLRTLEYELACPPSPLELVVARLIVVLSYDALLGLALGLALLPHGGQSVLALTFHWLMPQLLIAGLALFLSLRMSSGIAAGAAYGAWIVTLICAHAVNQLASYVPSSLPLYGEVVVGLVGVMLLALALAQVPDSLPHLYPGAE